MVGQVRPNLVGTWKAIAGRSFHQLIFDIPRSFRKNQADNNILVLDALGGLGTLDERHLQDIRVRPSHRAAQERSQIIVPTDPEAVVPATKDGVPKTKLQVRVAVRLSRTVPTRRNVADIIDEVGIDRTGLERVLELAQCRRGQILVAANGPLHTRKLARQFGAIVAQPVSFLSCQVTTPMGHFQVTFQQRSRDNRVGELVANGDRVGRSRCDLRSVVGTVCECRALAFGVRARASLQTLSDSKVRNLRAWELQLRLLGNGRVGRNGKAGEGVGEELTVRLFDGGRTWVKGIEKGVRDPQGDLRLGGERFREMNDKVFEVTTIKKRPSSASIVQTTKLV